MPRKLTAPDEIAASRAFGVALKGCGRTQEAVAVAVKVSQGTVWQWANERLAIPADRAIAAARETNSDPREISVAYRIVADKIAERARTSPEQEPTDYDRYAFVSRIKNAQLAAGFGRVNYDVDEIDHSHAFRKDWLASKGLHADQCHIVGVCGDSMLPALPDGCVVLVDTSDTSPIKNGKPYAIVMNGEARVKRLFERVDGSLEIRSDNPAPQYAPETITPEYRDRVIVVGRVRWHSAEDD